QPDLVLAWRSGNAPRDLERLRQLVLPVYESEVRTLSDIPRALRTIGALADTREAAERAAVGFERHIERLRARQAGTRRVRVFYEVWRRPLTTVNGAHFISRVIELCGGFNVFADARTPTPVVTAEALIAARPEAVIGG